ncbi:hypothetical protein ACIGB8_08395 [Promicromonospora sukumoe]|uniref:hypothetical protein n=1 Tax=Promicromonospora sukumoe TaxID=88382 RepID=UPI0037CC8F4F
MADAKEARLKAETVQYCDVADFSFPDADAWKLLSSFRFGGSWKNVVSGAYSVSDDQLISFGEKEPVYLRHYRDHYATRLRPEFRSTRRSVVVEFEPIALRAKVSGVDAGFTEAHVTATVHHRGVGTLVVRYNGSTEPPLATAIALRSSEHLTIQVLGSRMGSGDRSLKKDDFVRLLIDEVSALVTGHSRPIATPSPPATSHDSAKLERVPAYFACIIESKNPGATLNVAIENDALALRGLLTGDKNWKYKRQADVERSLRDLEVGSRDTAPWYVSPDGTLCILASDFETDRVRAKALVVFELEILLSLRRYLLKTAFELGRILETDAGPVEAARIRNRAFGLLAEFYKAEVCQKDTMRFRMEHCQKVLGIMELLDSVRGNADAASEMLSLMYQERIAERSHRLTQVFGLVGVAGVVATLETLLWLDYRWWTVSIMLGAPILAGWAAHYILGRGARKG